VLRKRRRVKRRRVKRRRVKRRRDKGGGIKEEG